MGEAQRAQAPRDLLDFSVGDLYFETLPDQIISELLKRASFATSDSERQKALEQADKLAPDDLNVIVACYRNHYFRHDYESAVTLAYRAMHVSARMINIPQDWRVLSATDIEHVADKSMPTLRFFLWALKGLAYLLMRLDRFDEAMPALEKVIELDSANRLNCEPLLALAREYLSPEGEIE